MGLEINNMHHFNLSIYVRKKLSFYLMIINKQGIFSPRDRIPVKKLMKTSKKFNNINFGIAI